MAQSLPVLNSDAAAATVNFNDKLAEHGLELRGSTIETLQVNVGKLCNQACKHCHVDASPSRTEIMTREIVNLVLDAIRKFRFKTVDITGGAPELNPSFRYLVAEVRSHGSHVIVRHNLTVLFEPGQMDLPEFFRDHRVEIISSLPYFLEDQTDAQRGKGVFTKSIQALRRLNEIGYGMDGGELRLNLVYNPVGAFLPPSQASIEADFKRELRTRYDVSFNQLYTITNMPIKRFLEYLRRSGNEERYRRKLVAAFNPQAVPGLMCRTLISVDWTGRLYDCDFNQMLDLGVSSELPQSIADWDPARFTLRRIVTGPHCFGCTAGAGSSCGGTVA
ncbi:MAG: arsenosugar biosynthesis radical SAM protein ArsS [Acidobacteria bacterium]|nr:arsenosugar biosynthesis radical SAM protein ArsS [Acidobacteriota bacterium]